VVSKIFSHWRQWPESNKGFGEWGSMALFSKKSVISPVFCYLAQGWRALKARRIRTSVEKIRSVYIKSVKIFLDIINVLDTKGSASWTSSWWRK
jgi:hypothetical protein